MIPIIQSATPNAPVASRLREQFDITNHERLLTRVEAAACVEELGIPCSPKTLAKLASIGQGGPPYRRAGPYALYERRAVLEWALAKLSPLVRSAAELSSARSC